MNNIPEVIQQQKRPCQNLRTFFPVFILALSGTVLAYVAFLVINNHQAERASKSFYRISQERLSLIEETFKHSIETVESLNAFYGASQEVTKEEFGIFANNLLLTHKNIQAFEWIPHVTADKRHDFEEKAKNLFPDFKIQELGLDGGMVQAEEREYYFPVYYVEPYQGNEEALGFDLASHPERRATLKSAWASGEITSSGPVNLMQEKEDQKEILVFVPVYQNGTAIETVAERKAHLEGFVLSVHRIGAMLEEALHPLAQAQIEIRIEGITTDLGGDLLFTEAFKGGESGLSRETNLESNELILEKRFSVAGHEWRILATGTTLDFRKGLQWWETASPIGIFVVAGFLASYLLLIIRQREERAMALETLMTEISERKKTEQSLQDSEVQFRTIFEQSTDSIFLIEPNTGRIVAFNEKAHQSLGYTREEFIGFKISDFEAVKTEADTKKHIEDILAIRRKTFQTKHRTKEGLTRDVEVTVSVIKVKEKPFLLSVIHDFTEQRQAEAKDRLSSTVINSAAEAVLITDADEKIISVNPAFIEVTGYSEEEVIGQTPRMFQSGKHDKAFYQEMWNILSATGQWQGEIWDRKKNGTVYPKWLSIIAIKDETGKTTNYTSLFNDISERKEMEKQLRQTQKLETIGQLAGGVAHEFNNLLTPIIGYVEILLEQTLNQPKVQDPLFMVRKAAQRAARLTKELLSFSHQTPINLKSQSLSDLTLEVEHLLRQAIDRKIEITVESSDNLWPAHIDTDQIHQVIVNLCVNSRDTLKECMLARDNFKPLIEIKLKNVHLDREYCKAHLNAKIGDFVCLSVSDNGSGIDEAAVPHLFEPFFTTKEIGKGTGLGLASTHGIVKRHKGWIDLRTAKDEGTTFEVYLPRTGRPVEATHQKLADKPVTHDPMTIMIVDDDEFIRELGKVALERQGHTVLLAEGGNQALDIFKEERRRIKIVILDLTMPHESGWEVLRRLRALDPALKVIISSGHDISDQTKKKGNLELYTVLSKPFTPSDMGRVIREVLEQGQRL